MVSINDLADRPPARSRPTAPIDLGGPAHPQHRHAPRAPRLGRARARTRRPPARCSAATSSRRSATARPSPTDDILDAAAQAEDMFGATCLTPQTAPTIRRLADLRPDDAGDHARLVVQRRCRQGPARAGRRLRTAAGRRQLTAETLSRTMKNRSPFAELSTLFGVWQCRSAVEQSVEKETELQALVVRANCGGTRSCPCSKAIWHCRRQLRFRWPPASSC